MKSTLFRFTAALLFVIFSGGIAHGQGVLQNRPRKHEENRPAPPIQAEKAAPPVVQQPPPQPSPSHRNHHPDCRPHFSYTYYPNSSFGGYYDGYPISTYYYYYPLFYYANAEDLYGPQAAQRFLGVQNPVARADDLQGSPPSEKVLDRATNAQSKALAWRFIAFGDAQFAQGNYVAANSRYRKAAQTAPQLADAHFRQAFALAAMGRDQQAAAALARGLELDPRWPQGDFHLQELFGDDEAAKDAFLEDFEERAERTPHDPNLQLMVGVCLFCDGRKEQAQKVFQRASRLVGRDDGAIRAFGEP